MSGDSQDSDEIERLREKRKAEILENMKKMKNPGVVVVDELNFQSFLEENRFAVIDMWAEWCGPCRRVAPVIEELAHDYSGRITFGKCNTDENQSLAAAFSISAIPSLLFFSDGKLINRVTGAYPKDALEKQIKSTFPSV
ncbi:MAG: thioredoxin [Methanomicrobiaceae archaeon]|nr:thioredoxin [Methanomicrobiaceae archaeon]